MLILAVIVIKFGNLLNIEKFSSEVIMTYKTEWIMKMDPRTLRVYKQYYVSKRWWIDDLRVAICGAAWIIVCVVVGIAVC